MTAESVGLALAGAEAAVKLVVFLKDSYVAHRRNSQDILSLLARVKKIKGNLQNYKNESDVARIPNAVFKRIADDFDVMNAELRNVKDKLSTKPKVVVFFRSKSSAVSLNSISTRLAKLEDHIDVFGLLSDLKSTLQCDLASVPTAVADAVAKQTQESEKNSTSDSRALADQLAGITAQLSALLTAQSVPKNQSRERDIGQSKDAYVDLWARNEAFHVARSSMPPNVRRLPEKLSSCGESTEFQQRPGQDLSNAFDGWKFRYEAVAGNQRPLIKNLVRQISRTAPAQCKMSGVILGLGFWFLVLIFFFNGFWIMETQAGAVHEWSMILRRFSSEALDGPRFSWPQAHVRVPHGWKVLSGGAQVQYFGDGQLLTNSYPLIENGVVSGWTVQSKDHFSDDPGRIQAHAIAIFDPFNKWDVKVVVSEPSSLTKHPQATARLPPGYTLVGGGASTHWSGHGSLLVDNYPVNKGEWFASSKDHKEVCTSTIVSYAIGLKLRNGGTIKSRIVSNNFGYGGHLEGHVNAIQGWGFVGGGSKVSKGGYGNMLVNSYPSQFGRAFIASSKDHLVVDKQRLTVYGIEVEGAKYVNEVNEVLGMNL